MPTVTKDVKPHKPLPAPNTDFYYLYETLPAEELAIVKRVREFMETKVEPVITDYWVRDEFPFELLPAVKELGIGCFGLTEPLVGSGASGGLMTTAKRDGDTWILDGEKRWIGNAPWCDVSIIWARDVADNQVKGFIVENKTTPGFSVDKIENKVALKVVQNGHITLKDCRVPEENRLQGGNSFRDTAKVLKMTRYAVAWMST